MTGAAVESRGTLTADGGKVADVKLAELLDRLLVVQDEGNVAYDHLSRLEFAKRAGNQSNAPALAAAEKSWERLRGELFSTLQRISDTPSESVVGALVKLSVGMGAAYDRIGLSVNTAWEGENWEDAMQDVARQDLWRLAYAAHPAAAQRARTVLDKLYGQ